MQPTTQLGAPPPARAADALLRDLAAGSLSSVELTTACLDRIADLDPLLGAVITVDPYALEQAAASDRRRRQRRPGPLEGVPVLVKDNIAVTGSPTTAGSRALAASCPPDAEAVRRLRAAGAVVLGKTNLSEWGNIRSTRSTSGWSAVRGQTRNPHVLDRTPSGSSSGSAAAVAAGLAPLALGTESDGSIISPAGTCGVVGLKPTFGTVPTGGVVPLWAGQDVVGPMARSVADAALLYAVLTGGSVPRLDDGALAGARIGIWQPPGATAPATSVLDEAVAVLRDAGADPVPVEIAVDRIPAKVDPALLAGFRADLDAYLATVPGASVRSVAELTAFNRADAVELSRFGQENLELSLTLPDVDRATAALHTGLRRSAARGVLDAVLGGQRLAAVLTLSNGPAPRIGYGSGDGPEILTTTPAAVAGYPMVTVPAGFAGALPIGVTFIGSRQADARLLALAHGFERRTAARRNPRLRPSLD
jgi:amidase